MSVLFLRSGGDKDDEFFSQRKSEGLCVIATDAGYTKADKSGVANPNTFFCLYFARGLCSRGKNCEYLHRLPQLTDIFPPNLDCFGRDKFSDYRDDMGGVGSFLRQNRTLYVGRITVTEGIEEIVARHFSEWGEVEKIRVLNNRGVAFVTYVNEANAQFAKEAMAHQSLDNDKEVLNVRWANEDPNPAAKVREKRRLEEQAAETIRKLLPKAMVDELEGKPSSKRIKKNDFGLEGFEAPESVRYGGEVPTVEELEDDQEAESTQPLAIEDSKPGTGLFSSDSLARLQHVAKSIKPVAVPLPKSTGLGLADYGSDDDE